MYLVSSGHLRTATIFYERIVRARVDSRKVQVYIPLQRIIRQLTKFQAHEATTWRQDSVCFLQYLWNMYYNIISGQSSVWRSGWMMLRMAAHSEIILKPKKVQWLTLSM